MPVIIDTDPGIDDAIAILYALRHPGMEVAALTSVGGNIGLAETTRNAGRIAALAQANVPVHAGAAGPLNADPATSAAIHGADGLGGVTFPDPVRPAETDGAVAAIAALLAAHPAGTLDLLCLGPLTNLAALLEAHPEAARRLGRVIAMGGAVDVPGNVGPRAEFNLAHDATAASRVLSAGFDLTLIPLDATRQLRADREDIAALRGTGRPAAQVAAALIEAYFEATDGAGSRPLHDPCVPLLATRPELFRVETRHLDVDLATGALGPGDIPVRVATGLEAEPLRAELALGLSA